MNRGRERGGDKEEGVMKGEGQWLDPNPNPSRKRERGGGEVEEGKVEG